MKEKTNTQKIKQMTCDVYTYAKRLEKLKKQKADVTEKLDKAAQACGVQSDVIMSMNLKSIAEMLASIPDTSKHVKAKLLKAGIEYCETIQAVNDLETELKAFLNDVNVVKAESRANVVDKYGEIGAMVVEAVAEAMPTPTAEQLAAGEPL